jgi:hypothetical protein
MMTIAYEDDQKALNQSAAECAVIFCQKVSILYNGAILQNKEREKISSAKSHLEKSFECYFIDDFEASLNFSRKAAAQLISIDLRQIAPFYTERGKKADIYLGASLITR